MTPPNYCPACGKRWKHMLWNPNTCDFCRKDLIPVNNPSVCFRLKVWADKMPKQYTYECGSPVGCIHVDDYPIIKCPLLDLIIANPHQTKWRKT